MLRTSLPVVLMLLALVAASADDASGGWHSDYSTAYKAARSDGKFLLVWFTSDKPTDAEAEFAKLFDQEKLATTLEDFVRVRMAKSDKALIDDKPVWLLGHAAFGELLKSPGLAIIDLRDKQSPHYGNLVSVYPFRSGKPLDATKLQVLLELPTGTLTQRTMVFAVRTHPEQPRSTQGIFDPLLASETAKHSTHQASITLQGHHNWEQRFQLISAKLPDRLLAQEVCAESWPGQNLVEAAEECVHSWRQSSGHWSAVSGAHPRFGYDMKRGRNGVWYATGIFGKR
jgi:hypothetical protein